MEKFEPRTLVHIAHAILNSKKENTKTQSQNTSCIVKGHIEKLSRSTKMPSTFDILGKVLVLSRDLALTSKSSKSSKRPRDLAEACHFPWLSFQDIFVSQDTEVQDGFQEIWLKLDG